MKKGSPKVSVVVATLNSRETLRKTLRGLLALSYPRPVEIIVVNDGSSDGTREMLDQEFSRKVKSIHLPRSGVCIARNIGIENASGEIVVIMDHDCIPERDWLRRLVSGFDAKNVGVVSSYGYYGGTSTAFRKELLHQVGGYDPAYVYYREDTDLSFTIMDLGYEFRLVEAGYLHDHTLAKPRGIAGAIRYALQRWKYHMNDVLLFKKHPRLAGRFLDVKLGFLVNPLADFRAATGLWQGRYELSSPRGITFLENRSPLHSVLIFLVGLACVAGVKAFRLRGSLKFGRLLV